MRVAAAALVAAAVCLAGCGGNAQQQARKTVRNFVKATNERDGDAYCDKLVTRAFVEDATGASGDNAKDVCKRELRLQRVPKVRLVDIQRTRVEGDRAQVTALLQAGEVSHPQVFRLRKQGGDWRISDNTGQ
jgi:Domain of unknown function (DUF4878)